MKKQVLLAITSLTFTTGWSQITLGPSDVASVGDSVRQAHDTLTAVTPGPKGASQTWNFNNLQQHIIDTTVFVNPTSTTYAASFPAANLCAKNSGGNYIYLDKNASSMDVVGQEADLGFGPWALRFNPHEKALNLPGTYNSTFNGTSVVDEKYAASVLIYDSVHIRHRVIYVDTMDAWGNVTTPVATYPCLRQKFIEYSWDSIYAHNMFSNTWDTVQTSADTTVSYRWWANSRGVPVVEIQTNGSGAVTSRQYLLWSTTGVNEIAQRPVNLKTYPNPAINEVTIVTSHSGSCTVKVSDETGRIVMALQASGEQIELNLQNLSPGFYFADVSDKSGVLFGRARFSVVR